MKKYTLGIIFDQTRKHVLLMHKSKPAFQAGKMNALGGKIEEGETALSCVSREILEESALLISETAWTHIGMVHGLDWTMEVFAHVYAGAMSDARSLEKERIEWVHVDQLPANVISNLPWMIPFALEALEGSLKECFILEIETRQG